MPRPHPGPWHRDSLFGEGPRLPMCRERRAVWKARLELHRRAGRITDGESYVGLALLRRLGQDGRCDPSHQTLADDSGESVSTVQRALRAFRGCGLVSWVRRLVRDGWRAAQTSNAYILSADEPSKISVHRCDGHADRQTQKIVLSSVQPAAPWAIRTAQAALAHRRQVIEARLLNEGRGRLVPATGSHEQP